MKATWDMKLGWTLIFVEAKPCVAVGHSVAVINYEDQAGGTFDRCGPSVESEARHVKSKGTNGKGGTDREGRRRKQIMGVGPIGELDAFGGDGPRTLFPPRPKAATAPHAPGSPMTVDRVRAEQTSSGEQRVVNQPMTPTAFDQGEACYSSISVPKRVGASVFSIEMKGDDEEEMRTLMDNLTRDLSQDVKQLNHEILSIVRSMGGNVGQYKRERRKGIKAVVSEIYSAPRNTAAITLLPELRLVPGFALDLTVVDPDPYVRAKSREH